MITKILYIIRGLPGAGKSTLAKKLAPIYYSADDYFINPITLEYEFDKDKLKEAHEWCYDKVHKYVRHGFNVAVANTFTRTCEYERYLKLAKQYKYEPVVITIASNFKSIHNVPDNTINAMRDRFEYEPVLSIIDIKSEEGE